MTGNTEIRKSEIADLASLETLYRSAGTEEDLLPLVQDLMIAATGVLSLAATHDGRLIGHAAFTRCAISGRNSKPTLLGPLVVSPEMQNRGIGSALVREGLRLLTMKGVNQVHVLGDPDFYGRFGFTADKSVTPPFPVPRSWNNAWQSLPLIGDCEPLRGKLSVPRPWRRQALWAP
jgi:putative acetyltransferase